MQVHIRRVNKSEDERCVLDSNDELKEQKSEDKLKSTQFWKRTQNIKSAEEHKMSMFENELRVSKSGSEPRVFKSEGIFE
jgi:hypothetical protein